MIIFWCNIVQCSGFKIFRVLVSNLSSKVHRLGDSDMFVRTHRVCLWMSSWDWCFRKQRYFLVITGKIKKTLFFHDDTLDTAACQRLSRHKITFSYPYIKQENSRPIYTQGNGKEQRGEDNLIAKGKSKAVSMLRDQLPFPHKMKWSYF